MNWVEIIIVSLALAVDATVYSFSYGLILKQRRTTSALWLAITTGAYQAGMPLLGYLFGHELKIYVEGYSSALVLSFSACWGHTLSTNPGQAVKMKTTTTLPHWDSWLSCWSALPRP